ncbi:MAG TPA: asparagine synthase (glutamine-hydrolyzing) [Flavobacteriales bacterium]|nr:asparagine synthase (glutamine-hydrolyzing) [Flavobacteriales bacterium]
MCGINGVYFGDSSKEINRAMFEHSLKSMAYRGPDHCGMMFEKGIALGHNRLSIIDVSANANQPFFSADRRFALVFNGEIFNYRELKNQLALNGEQFLTNSDTEVLLKMLIQQGVKALHKLNGFFAFAFYDFEKHQLLVARDRFGEKPLFYALDQENKSLVFGSELKAVAAFVPQKKLDHASLRLLLHLSYIPSPHTIIEGVKKMNPGECLIISKTSAELQKWYELPQEFEIENSDEREIEKKTRLLVEAAVSRRMISDVPVAGFLSGGIDSTIVSALAKKINPGYETFSLGFTENKFIDESADAVFAAKQFGIKHNVIKLSENEMLESVHDLFTLTDEPFGDSSRIALYSLCKKIKGQFKVILSGDGADEVFAGYNKHYALYRAGKKNMANALVRAGGGVHRLLPKSRNSPLANKFRQLEKMYNSLKRNDFERYWFLAGFNVMQAGELLNVGDNAFKDNLRNSVNVPGFNKYLYYDLKLVLPGDMLYKVDTASMYNSMEIRSPFLDHELIEYAFTLPGELKIKNGNKKHLLKTTFKDLLPPAIINKPKHGFEVPLQQWLNGPLKTTVNEMLGDKFIKEQGIFNAEKVAVLLKKLYSSSPGDSASTVWTMLNFQHSWQIYFNA